MSKGVLLYAFDNKNYRYGKIASINAGLIQRHLGLPVSVVTDKYTEIDRVLFDHVIYPERKPLPMSLNIIDNGAWNVVDRSDYFNVTPYEETLVLDVDYLQFNNNLSKLFGTGESVYLSYYSSQPDGGPVADSERRISPFSIDMCWATCLYFRKDERAKVFFDYLDYVRENYLYFSYQYNLVKRGYRNDFAFSIADHLYSGLSPKNTIGRNPFKIITAYTDVEIAKVHGDGLIVYNRDTEQLHDLRGQSVHLLNKRTIEERYDEFVREFY